MIAVKTMTNTPDRLPFEPDLTGFNRQELVDSYLICTEGKTVPSKARETAHKIADLLGTGLGAVRSGFLDEYHLHREVNGIPISVYVSKGMEE